jgi:hypothetical protein
MLRIRSPGIAPASTSPATGKVWVKVGGVWKQATVSIKVGGVWKTVTPYVKSGGAWKSMAI